MDAESEGADVGPTDGSAEAATVVLAVAAADVAAPDGGAVNAEALGLPVAAGPLQAASSALATSARVALRRERGRRHEPDSEFTSVNSPPPKNNAVPEHAERRQRSMGLLPSLV